MSDQVVDIAALRKLHAALDPSLLPLQVCAGVIPRTYFVQAANGEQFAAVHNARLAEAALVVESINQLPALLDELEVSRARIAAQKAALNATVQPDQLLHELREAAERA